MKQIQTCIIVDDDPINVFFHKKVMNELLGYSNLTGFTEAKLALTYIEETYSPVTDSQTLLLLDLEMPVMSGQEFIKEFLKLDQKIKEQIKIVIVTSLDDTAAVKSISTYSCVYGVLLKPFSLDRLNKIMVLADNKLWANF